MYVESFPPDRWCWLKAKSAFTEEGQDVQYGGGLMVWWGGDALRDVPVEPRHVFSLHNVCRSARLKCAAVYKTQGGPSGRHGDRAELLQSPPGLVEDAWHAFHRAQRGEDGLSDLPGGGGGPDFLQSRGRGGQL